MFMAKVLLVEDDTSLGASLEKYLKNEGQGVTWAKNLNEAKSLLKDVYQVIILDWMLPDGQGIDLLRELRQKHDQTPVVMLTAKTELIDKVLGLESGANDYLTKPFEPRELLARIRVQERQFQLQSSPGQSEKVGGQKIGLSESEQKGLIALNGITMDLVRREVHYKGQLIELTKMEFDLLHLLMEYPNRAFSREELLNKVWGYENYPTTRTVDTHVLQLRQKLYEDLIETVRGIGYRLRKVDFAGAN